MDLQTRSASAVASFISFCVQKKMTSPPEKIVKNLCTFLCQDVEQTPAFTLTKGTEKGVLSAKSILKNEAQVTNGRGNKGAAVENLSDEATKAKVSRRGAELAFTQLSLKFVNQLFELVPSMWGYMAGGLLTTYAEGMLMSLCLLSRPDLSLRFSS